MFPRQRAIRIALPCLTFATLLAGPRVALAQDVWSQNFIKPGTETVIITLGGILNTFDTKFTLNGQSTRGTNIDLESNDLAKSRGSFDAGLTWRFFPRHRLDFNYFQVKRSGTKNYSDSITIGDNTFPVGASVSVESKNNFLLGNYRYSFIKQDNLEVAGLIGIYGGHVDFSTSATGNVNGNTRTVSTDSSTTLPLPILGGTVDWYVSPQLTVSGGLSGLKAKIGDVDGRIFVGSLAGEYMFSRNFGLGLRYMYTDMNVDVTKTNFNGSASWRLNSTLAYIKMMF
jgi:hypothetical protein